MNREIGFSEDAVEYRVGLWEARLKSEAIKEVMLAALLVFVALACLYGALHHRNNDEPEEGISFSEVN